MTKTNELHRAGRRKEAVARVWLRAGSGEVTINDRKINDYFKLDSLVWTVKRPLELAGVANKYNVLVNVNGGGTSGQSGAIAHGISRALLLLNPDLRPMLRQAGLLTRDPRGKERKKYGQKGARARFQFSKR